MSYCVNCGVELDASLKACPLCHTPVIHQNRAERAEKMPLFPEKKEHAAYAKKLPYISIYTLLLSYGIPILLSLYLITFLTKEDKWFFGLAVPITALLLLAAEILLFCFRKLPSSFLMGAVYFVSVAALFCTGLEALLCLYQGKQITLRWSFAVLIICAVLDIALLTLMTGRRFRNMVRKRLHF